MAQSWTFTINTGNPAMDQQEAGRQQQAYQAQGMQVYVQPLPTGGYQLTVTQVAAAAQPPPTPARPQQQRGLSGTMIMDASPVAAPATNSAAATSNPAWTGAAQPQPVQPQQAQPQQAQPQQAQPQQAQPQQAQPQQAQPQAAGYGASAQSSGYGQYAQPAQQGQYSYGQAGSSPGAAYPAQAAAAVAGAWGQAAGQSPASSAQASSTTSSSSAGPSGIPGAPGMAAYAMAGGGAYAATAVASSDEGVVNQVAEAVGAPPLSAQRLKYLRKVYGLLGAAAFLAVFAGWASVSLGPTAELVSPEGIPAKVPALVAIMLLNEGLMYLAFGLLFVSTIAASWVSKIPIINVAALMGVAILMGIELAPMVFVAQFYSGLGGTMTAEPVRDAMIMVLAVFTGITGYVFVARKDFSWMGSILSMGFLVVMAGCVMTFFLDSEPFSLAVASVGALFSIGMLLYVTSYIFRNSEMDDPVGDALALLVQLRNLFMFLLRIFMSRR